MNEEERFTLAHQVYDVMDRLQTLTRDLTIYQRYTRANVEHELDMCARQLGILLEELPSE